MRSKLLLLLVVLAALAGFGLYHFRPWPVDVRIIRPEHGPAVEAVYATGNVEPVNPVVVGATLTARIAAIDADEGDKVEKGTLLAQLDDSQPRATCDELKAKQAFAGKELARQSALYRSHNASRQAFERAQSDLGQAEAAAEAACARLRDYRLVSPIAGVVLRREAELGQVVEAGKTVFWIGALKPLRITAQVDEQDIPRVHVGAAVLISADAFKGEVLHGTVSEITPQGDPVNQTFRVRIRLPLDTPLRIGMTTEVNIVVRENPHALLIPAAALDGDHVWVVVAGHAYERKVELGVVGTKVEITKGLTGQEALVLSPPARLKNGALVRIQTRARP